MPTSSRCDQDDEGVIVVDSEEDDERCSGTMYRVCPIKKSRHTLRYPVLTVLSATLCHDGTVRIVCCRSSIFVLPNIFMLISLHYNNLFFLNKCLSL